MLECFFIFPGLAREFGMTKVNEADPLMGIKTIHLPIFPPLHPFNKYPSSTMLSFIYEAVTFAFFLIIFFIILAIFLSSSPPSPTPNPIFTPLPGQDKVAPSSTQPMGYCG